MKLYILTLLMFLSNGFMYGEFMKIKYQGNELHVMNLQNKNDHDSINNYNKIKRAAVPSGYIKAIQNWWLSLNVLYNMTPKTNNTLFFRL